MYFYLTLSTWLYYSLSLTIIIVLSVPSVRNCRKPLSTFERLSKLLWDCFLLTLYFLGWHNYWLLNNYLSGLCIVLKLNSRLVLFIISNLCLFNIVHLYIKHIITHGFYEKSQWFEIGLNFEQFLIWLLAHLGQGQDS